MRGKLSRKAFALLMSAMMMVSFMPALSFADTTDAASTEVKSLLMMTGTAKSGKQVVKWTEVSDAEGYDVFFAKCGSTMKKVKTVKAGSKLTFTKKKLDNKKTYKWKIKAFNTVDGEKNYVTSSPTIHIAGKSNKYSNATAVKLSQKTAEMKVDETLKLVAKISAKSSKKAILPKGHVAAMRYYSSNKAVAKVNSTGTITAIGKGECYVYAVAPSGVYAKAKVTVTAEEQSEVDPTPHEDPTPGPTPGPASHVCSKYKINRNDGSWLCVDETCNEPLTGTNEAYCTVLTDNKRPNEGGQPIVIIPLVNDGTYPVGDDVGTITVAGNIIRYTNEGTAQTVVIRTTSLDTELTINAPKDVIEHYDTTGTLNIIESATKSFHEYGKVPFVEIKKGRIALEEGAEVEKLHFNANDKDEFDNIIVSYDKENNVTLPDFSRDVVDIKETGTLVVELQDSTDIVGYDSDYIWLYKQGVISQIVVTEKEVEGIQKSDDDGKYYGYTSTESKKEEVALGVSEKTAAGTQKAAVEIANNYKGSHGSNQTIGGREVNVAELDVNDDIMTEAGKGLPDTIAEFVTEGGGDSKDFKENTVLKVYNSVTHLGDGETFQFEFDGDNVNWTSSNTDYITVDNNGLVTVVNGGGEATITATMGDQSYSCDITTWYFHNGNYEWYYSTAEIANAKQWINMTTCYESSYAGYYYFFGNYKLINDIDFTGVTFYNDYYAYNLDLDGNGHTISNIEACDIFGNYGISYWKENKIYDLTIENCSFNGQGIGYGTMGYDTDALTVTNVDMNNCSAYQASYLCYSSKGTVTFKDCDVSGAAITGGTGMSIGGFCGQWHTSGITIDTCTFEGSIKAVGNQASGFVTMHNSAKVTIKNSEIKEGTIIKNVSTGAINAFSNDLSSDSTGNTFNGYAKTAKTVTTDNLTNDIKKGQWETIAVPTASDFKLENGILTYIGNSQFTTAKVYQSVSVERYDADEDKWYSSYEWNITPSYKTSNLVNGKQLAGFETIEHIYNLVGNDGELSKCFLSVSDRTVIDNAKEVGSQNFYLVDNTAYLEAKTYESGSYYVLTGTRGETAPESIKVTVHVILYDGTEEAGSISLSYNVSETK